MKEATLEIGLMGSRCSACGQAADYREKDHLNMVLAGKGCGAHFIKVTPLGTFFEEERTAIIQTIQEKRPDLPLVINI